MDIDQAIAEWQRAKRDLRIQQKYTDELHDMIVEWLDDEDIDTYANHRFEIELKTIQRESVQRANMPPAVWNTYKTITEYRALHCRASML